MYFSQEYFRPQFATYILQDWLVLMYLRACTTHMSVMYDIRHVYQCARSDCYILAGAVVIKREREERVGSEYTLKTHKIYYQSYDFLNAVVRVFYKIDKVNFAFPCRIISIWHIESGDFL